MVTQALSASLSVIAILSVRGVARAALRDRIGSRLFEHAAALLLGLAVWSETFTLVLFIAGRSQATLIAKDCLIVGIAVWSHGRTRSIRSKSPDRGTTASPRRHVAIVGAAFFIACVAAAFIFGHQSFTSPDGDWDAWMIWNLRARFIVRAADYRQAFSSDVALSHTHPDYPPLLPALVAQAWIRLGAEYRIVPILIAFLFAACTLVFLVEGTRLTTKSTIRGLVGGLGLLATPIFLWQSPAQLADIPLGAFVLLSAVCLALTGSSDRLSAPMYLSAGIAAGCAALTKNEGILFLVATAAAAAAFCPGRTRLRNGVRFFVGAAPSLALLGWFRLGFAPESDLLSSLDMQTVLGRIVSLERHALIIRGVVSSLTDGAHWSVLGIIVPAAAATVFAVRSASHNARRSSAQLWMVASGFYFVYLITPYDLTWHINTSVDRLALQCWPLALFTACCAAPSRSSGEN